MVGYFQVAESKITVSQVIVALLECPYGSVVSKSGYFQVAESQVISVLHVASLASYGSGNRVTSRWRNPRSSVLSTLLGRLSSSRGNGLLSGCAVPSHLRSPFIGSLLPGGGLERDCVPGHGENPFLKARTRRASRLRGRPKSCHFSGYGCESGLQIVI